MSYIFPYVVDQEPKRRFIPSKHERRTVMRMVNAIRNGWIVTDEERKKREEDLDLPYLLWGVRSHQGVCSVAHFLRRCTKFLSRVNGIHRPAGRAHNVMHLISDIHANIELTRQTNCLGPYIRGSARALLSFRSRSVGFTHCSSLLFVTWNGAPASRLFSRISSLLANWRDLQLNIHVQNKRWVQNC